MNENHARMIAGISIPLALLLAVISSVGLVTSGFYGAETANWQAQSVGQDMIDLFLILPALIVTGIGAYKGKRFFLPLWGGVTLYLLYTFVIYSFAVHFNVLFVLYCLALGLAFYGFLWFLLRQIRFPVLTTVDRGTIRITGIYFIFIAVLFYFLWLSEILPSIFRKETPASLIEVGLFTNPVHVLDLAVFLPGLLIAGLLVLKRHPFGFSLAPVFLTFTVLMNITIGGLILVMRSRGVEADLSVTFIMGTLALFSLWLLARFRKNISNRTPTTIEGKA